MCSVKKGVLKNFAKLTGKHLCQSLFFNKVKGTFSNTSGGSSEKNIKIISVTWMHLSWHVSHSSSKPAWDSRVFPDLLNAPLLKAGFSSVWPVNWLEQGDLKIIVKGSFGFSKTSYRPKQVSASPCKST